MLWLKQRAALENFQCPVPFPGHRHEVHDEIEDAGGQVHTAAHDESPLPGLVADGAGRGDDGGDERVQAGVGHRWQGEAHGRG